MDWDLGALVCVQITNIACLLACLPAYSALRRSLCPVSHMLRIVDCRMHFILRAVAHPAFRPEKCDCVQVLARSNRGSGA